MTELILQCIKECVHSLISISSLLALLLPSTPPSAHLHSLIVAI